MTGGVVSGVVVLLLATTANAQSIADRVGSVDDGQVRMSFTARPGVCGNGRNITTSRDTGDWESWCEPGPVRVAVDVRGGRVVDVDTYVGGRWRTGRRDVVDLGLVPAKDAADYLLSLATHGEGRGAKDAIFPATIADSAVVWPQLLAIAKDEARPKAIRKSAVFWVAQAAGEAVTKGLEELVDDDSGDREVRESAVFAISRLRNDEGVPILIRIVRTHPDRAIRKKAIFWLGQSDDPRAIALFEELLLKP
ncbi:MAG: HEAT repeat domain-containing protein [Gemmatimonadales bacterium]